MNFNLFSPKETAQAMIKIKKKDHIPKLMSDIHEYLSSTTEHAIKEEKSMEGRTVSKTLTN
jgi:hypothetical protein